jgi:hypothetical protein
LPEIYGLLDGKRLRCLTGLDYFTYFTSRHYQHYLDVIRAIAQNLTWQVQDVDVALWQIDEGKKTL